MIIESTSWCLNLNINNNIDMRVKKLKSPKILENDIRHMASLSLGIFFQNAQQNIQSHDFDHHELWIEIVFDETFSVGKYFYMASSLWNVFEPCRNA